MSDVSGIPNLGIPGLSGFNNQQSFINPSPGLQSAQDQYLQNQRFFGQQAVTQQAASVPQSQLYGPQGFGGATAQAAAAGAAAGRNTGGFNGGQQVAPAYGQTIADFNAGRGGSPSPVPVDSSIFDTAGTGPVPYTSGPFMSAGRGGSPSPSVFDTGAPPVPYSPPPGSFSPPPPPSYSPGDPFQTASPDRGRGAYFPTAGYQSPFNTPSLAADRGFSTGRFGAPSVPQADIPQQVNTSPVMGTPDPNSIYQGFPQFTNAGSTRAGPNAGGANPFTSGADPMPFPGRGGLPESSPFDVGGSHIGPTMGPFMSATPGGGVGRGQPSPSFAPSSPFDSGVSPFPFAGGYQGSMRDRIASAVTGPQNNLGTPISGPPLVNGGPDEPPTSPPASELASNAYGRLQDLQRSGSMPGGNMGNTFNPSSYGTSGIGSDMLRGGQNQPYAQPWHDLIPGSTPNTPEVIKQINYTAGRGRYDPAALANVIDTESQFNPQTNTGSYFGATQMGADSFSEAGGRLGGMNFGQYQQAPLEQQIPAYGDWLAHYARPGNAAGLASGGISDLPVPMQSAILQGTQFGPNSRGWPAALEQGNMNVNTSPIDPRTGRTAPQAEFLGKPPTINSMDTYFGRR